jgi:amino acid adenylation domain-containing protein
MRLERRIRSYLEQGFTLAGALSATAAAAPEAGITYVASDGGERFESYAALVRRAKRIAAGLRARGVAPGERVLLQLDDPSDAIGAFWGALFGGFVPAPLSVPSTHAASDPDHAKLRAVHAILARPMIVGRGDAARGLAASDLAPVRFAALCELASCEADGDDVSPRTIDDVAFLMFSSGSTGTPKGVRLTHANLLHNVRQIAERSELTEDDTTLSWLPLTHDMGLVLFHIVPALAGVKQVLLAPLTFVRQPALLLRKASEHRATITGAPNFAVDHLTRSIDEATLRTLDLSSLRALFNGAEPISGAVCRDFVRKMAPARLRADVIHPGYGIAEACVTATQHPASHRATLGACPSVFIDRDAFLTRARATVVEAERARDAVVVGSLGPPIPGMEIRIVDESGAVVPDGHVARIEVKGPNVTRGYETALDAAPIAPKDGWLATGDLGFLHEGSVFVTGREKDILFVNGRKFYSHDIEETIVKHTSHRLGRVAVVGWRDLRRDAERVTVFFASPKKPERAAAEAAEIADALAAVLPFPIDHVVPIASIPRTTSGKIQRYALRERLVSGELDGLIATVAEAAAEARHASVPASELEAAIMTACATEGAAVRLGSEASFVRLVGDSLRVAQLAAKLSTSGIHPGLAGATPGMLYEHRTPRALAAFLARGAQVRAPEVITRGTQKTAELSHAQKQLWLAHQLDPASTAYSEAHFCDLAPGTDIPRLEQAIGAVVGAHAALRTVFRDVDGAVHQEVLDAPDVDFAVIDLRSESPATFRAAALAKARADVATPLPLAGRVPARFRVMVGPAGRAALCVNVHHILVDGSSMSIVLRGIARAYARPDKIPAWRGERLRSIDYYDAHTRLLASDARDAAAACARDMLHPWPVRPELPAAEKGDGDEAGTRVSLLDNDLASRVHAAALRHGFTPYQLCLSAFALLMNHAAETADVTFGTTVSGRGSAEVQDLVAYIANTAAVRVDTSRTPTLRALIEAVAARSEELLRHQSIPLSALRRELDPPQAGWPPYSTVFTMMPAPEEDGMTARLFVGHEPVRVHAKADLLLAIETNKEAMRCTWEYRRSRHDDRQIGEWHNRWTLILRRILDDIDAPLVESRLLTERDRHAVAALQPPAAPPPKHLTLNGYIAETIARRPDSFAVSDPLRAITYNELNARAAHLAAKLRDLGATRNTFVPIVLPKGVEMIVACVAVLRAGAAYVPIDADHPEARIAELVARSEARLVIARDDVASVIRARLEPEALPRFVSPDVVVDHPLPDLADINEPDDLVYMHFTSGSTGIPKGVVNTHRSVCHLVDWYLAEGIYEVDHVIPQLPAFAFEASVGEIFPALAVGAQLHVFPSLRTLMPDQLLAELVRVGANVITITPTYLQRMLQHLDPESRRKWPLRRVMLAGEALLTTQAREFRARLGDDVVIANAYGPTEATLHATIAELPIAIPESSGSIPIGKPFRHRRAYVVNGVGQLCAPGTVGEIWLGGEGLASGYLGDEQKTRDAFVDLRIGDRTERVYRTGDYAVLQEDGALRFCGRRDGQVKVRGYRVEIGEVEDALRRLDAIDEAVVIPKPTGAGDTRLVAFFTAKADARPADLVAALGRLVPTYMIPSQFVKVESMPKSTNEKIDRKQLATLIPADPEPAPAHKAASPATIDDDPARRDVAEVLAEVLKAPHVGPDDNFFAIGGDSIGSMDVVAKLRKRGYRVEPADVLKHGTVRELAALLSSRRVKSEAPAAGPAALTPSQTRFFAEGPRATPWIGAIDIAGAVDADKLRAALAAVVAAHEALRVSFRKTALGVQPNVRDKVDDVRFVITDLRPVAADARAAVREKLAAEIAASVSQKAPFGAGLATDENGAHVIFALHPLAADAASAAIVAQDLALAYAAIAAGEPSGIGGGAAYRRVVQELADKADWDGDPAALTREHARWAGDLEAAGAWKLPPADGERARRIVLSGDALARLVTVQEGTRIALRDLVIGALARALAASTGQPFAPVELAGDARAATTEPEAARVVGAFDVGYPIVVPVSGDVIATASWVKQARGAVTIGGAGPDLLRFANGAAPEGMEVTADAPAARFAWRDERPHPLGPAWTFAGAAGGDVREGLDVVARADASRITIELTARGVLDDGAIDALVAALSRELGAAAERSASGEKPRFDASDFPLAPLDAMELASLPADTEDVYPLTPMQEGMLFAVLTDGESPVYHEQVVYEYDGALDAACLTRALQQLVARHEILRTVYRTEGVRRPAQIVKREGRADVASYDWRGRDERARKDALVALLEEDRGARFDLANGPLVRLIAVRTGDAQSLLVLAFHHIILDGWSQSALVAELVSRYEAVRDGAPLDVVPLRGRFSDFVQRVLPLAASQESAAFWKERMRSPTYNELPLDDARGDAPRAAAAHADQFFGVELTARLARFAAEKRVSLNAVCLAGYLYLLHTLTGDADVATGVITAGRLPEIPDGDRILGCFLNTFPVRVEFDPEKVTFDELVQATNEFLVAAKAHEHFPLKDTAKLVASGAAGGGRAELFSTLYAFQSYKDDAGGTQGLRVVGGHDTTNYDLAVLLFKDDQIRIVAEYASDVLTERTITRWLQQLVHVLDVLSVHASTPIHAVDLLPEEQRALYEQYNRTDVAFETDVTMNELFERTAARTPDAIAVSAAGALVRYGELNRDANRIARALVDRGAKPGGFVACALHRRGPAVAALMGVLKAGAAYVPIDPRYPTERIALLAKDCDARILITDRAAIRDGQVRLEELPGIEHVVLVDDATEPGELATAKAEIVDRAAWSRLDPNDLPRRGSPDDVAYVIYTSGSTGRPKGVVIRHYSAVNTIFGINRLYNVGPDDRVLCFSSFCFDLSVYDLFGTLAAGGEVVLATEDEIKSGEALLDLVDARAVTIWDSVPTGMSQLVQTRKLQPTSHRLTSLRLVMLSGEFIPLALPGEIRKTFPNASVSSLGGATEGTVWSIYYYPVTDVRPSWRSIPYGWPLPNQGYYVLNSAMKPCTIDQPGMLYIVGKGVAKEYFKDPEKTAASFVRDPFKNDPRAIIYKTGDLGRMKADGYIEIIGRKDAQVKIRGYRIELGEVENQLGLHPEVKEAAVLVAQDTQGHKRMVAYYATDAEALNGEGLAAYLRTKLPDYMVPSQFLRVEKMPVNSSGKIDRKRLPELAEGAKLALSTAYAAPESPIEIAIADVWKSVLAVERVGRDDNYFALGGDSILSLQVASRLAEKGYALKPSELFKHPTVARLAAILGRSAVAHADQAPVVGEAPLTPAQKWFFGRGFTDPKWWHFSLELEIREAVDPARLETALRAIADRHDVLRARYAETEAGTVQRFEAPTEGIALAVVDLSGEAPEARDAKVAEWARATRTDVDLAAGPITRATLIRLAPDQHRLIWAVHHLAVDVVSWRILAQELATAYAGGVLPPRSSSVRAWAERVEQALDAVAA